MFKVAHALIQDAVEKVFMLREPTVRRRLESRHPAMESLSGELKGARRQAVDLIQWLKKSKVADCIDRFIGKTNIRKGGI